MRTVVLWGILAALGGQDMTRADAVATARTALERAIRVPAETITLVDAVAARWPDASLGCPARGVRYAPVLSDGYRVTLEVGASRYAVHVGSGRAVVCGSPRAADARDTKRPRRDAVAGLRIARAASRDLARRLGVPVDRVTVEAFRPKVWPDSRLGCPGPGAAPTPHPTRGFEIDLRADGTRYTYHSDDADRVVPCPATPAR